MHVVYVRSEQIISGSARKRRHERGESEEISIGYQNQILNTGTRFHSECEINQGTYKHDSKNAVPFVKPDNVRDGPKIRTRITVC